MALLLAGSAIALSWGLSKLLAFYIPDFPSWIDAPSVVGIYAALDAWFDRRLWRCGLFHAIGLVKVPILAGQWAGYVQSSYDKFEKKHGIRIEIVQTWTRMRINLEGEFSRSHSFLAGIMVDSPDGVVLNYEYQNEPSPHAKETMQIHQGTGRLIIRELNLMEGDYYSGRGRSNFGHIHVSRT